MDGLSNALDYLLGSDPRDNASRAPLEVSPIDLEGQPFVELSHPLRDGVPESSTQIEKSSDLESWNAADDTLVQISDVHVDTLGTPRVGGRRTWHATCRNSYSYFFLY